MIDGRRADLYHPVAHPPSSRARRYIVDHGLDDRVRSRTVDDPAEVLHARREVEQELGSAKRAGIFLGAAALLSLIALSVLFVALAWVLPLTAPVGAVAIGVALLVVAACLGLVGKRALPTRPLKQ